LRRFVGRKQYPFFGEKCGDAIADVRDELRLDFARVCLVYELH